MMYYPSNDGFLSRVQETGYGRFTTTASDDIGIVVDSVRAHVWNLGISHDEFRIFEVTEGVYEVVVK